MYNLFSKIIIKNSSNFLFEHKPGIRVLDIGCGPATHTHNFLDTTYAGIDLSPEYIKKAVKKYWQYENVKFLCSDANIFFNEENVCSEKFDLVFMCGVLHHLNDNDVENVISSISRLLKPDGEFRSLDNVFVDNQSWFVRWLLRNDRGKYVRTIKEYEKLIVTHFPKASYTVRHDLLRIPYTHIIFSSHPSVSKREV
jgi:SAM-dependent methyltransferase